MEYKKGDRVRVTFEGVVTHAEDRIRVITDPDSLVSSIAAVRLSDPRVSIEKLSDPEPTWVNGDVVRRTYANDLEPLVRIRDAWLTVNHRLPLDDRTMAESWSRGQVEILYKADESVVQKKVA